MTLGLDLIQAIDARVDQARERNTATGTVSAITGFNDALVTFDGSALAIPVKLAGDADFLPGDRVALARFGLWWVALVPLTRRWTPHSGNQLDQTSGTTTSGAGVDVPNPVQCTFTKRWDATRVFVEVTAGAYVTVSNTVVTWGAYFSDPNQPVIGTYSVCKLLFNTASEHLSIRNSRIITDLIAGTYTVSVRWSRSSGTGTVTCDGNDQVGLSVMEISPT